MSFDLTFISKPRPGETPEQARDRADAALEARSTTQTFGAADRAFWARVVAAVQSVAPDAEVLDEQETLGLYADTFDLKMYLDGQISATSPFSENWDFRIVRLADVAAAIEDATDLVAWDAQYGGPFLTPDNPEVAEARARLASDETVVGGEPEPKPPETKPPRWAFWRKN